LLSLLQSQLAKPQAEIFLAFSVFMTDDYILPS